MQDSRPFQSIVAGAHDEANVGVREAVWVFVGPGMRSRSECDQPDNGRVVVTRIPQAGQASRRGDANIYPQEFRRQSEGVFVGMFTLLVQPQEFIVGELCGGF